MNKFLLLNDFAIFKYYTLHKFDPSLCIQTARFLNWLPDMVASFPSMCATIIFSSLKFGEA